MLTVTLDPCESEIYRNSGFSERAAFPQHSSGKRGSGEIPKTDPALLSMVLEVKESGGPWALHSVLLMPPPRPWLRTSRWPAMIGIGSHLPRYERLVLSGFGAQAAWHGTAVTAGM